MFSSASACKIFALDAAAAGSKDLSQAAAEADELSHDVVTAPGRRRWLARAKEEWLDFESVSKSAFVATLDSSQVCRSREDLQKAHATFKSGSPSVQRRFVRTYDWLTPLVDELVGAEDSMMFPLVNYALEQVVGENRQETLFDERRLTRDASTAEFYESLFGADEEDDALTKKCRGGSFLKQEPVTPLSPTPKASCF